jgi:hypothetical protein
MHTLSFAGSADRDVQDCDLLFRHLFVSASVPVHPLLFLPLFPV